MQLDFVRLFDALPSPHMVLDRSLRYVAANPAYQSVTLRKREELIGRNLFDLFPNEGEGGRRLRASFHRVFETGKPDTMAYIPYDIPRPDGNMDQRFWTAVHMPLTDREGNVTWLVQNTVDVTDIVRLKQAASLPYRIAETRLLERAREAEQQHRELISESDDFRRLFQQAPGFFAVMSGPDHVFTFANDAYVRLVGGRPVIGMTVREALPEVEGQGIFELLDEVYLTGMPRGGEAVRLVLQRSPDEPPAETFLDFSYDAIRNAEGGITGVFVQGTDRTDAVRTQARQKLLLDELNHRVKNTLATVQSIASQTLRSAVDLESARRDFESRIVALSNAHNLLSAKEWTSTALSEVIGQELAAYGRSRISIDGPPVTLTAKASISFALAVHELSTNAAKYGSLSVPGGTVRISWSVANGASGPLVLEWTERGGPPVAPPERKGFGSRMIMAIVAGELGGSFQPTYGSEGFACRIEADISALEA